LRYEENTGLRRILMVTLRMCFQIVGHKSGTQNASMCTGWCVRSRVPSRRSNPNLRSHCVRHVQQYDNRVTGAFKTMPGSQMHHLLDVRDEFRRVVHRRPPTLWEQGETAAAHALTCGTANTQQHDNMCHMYHTNQLLPSLD